MEDRMLNDEILLGLIKANSGGGGGGTDDYEDLDNLPQINSVELKGNKSLSDLGIASASAVSNILDGQSIDSFADVETALAGKQGTLTAGNNIKLDNNTISVNRWYVPAGKVVYTVITSDENYGQNVHVQRHTVGGAFIDDRTFTCVMYNTVTIDDLISIWNPYNSFKITLLKDSDEQQAGYNYTVSPISAATSNSFTFTMEQEENANDLIIRSELDAKADLTDLAPAFSTSTAYTVGQYVSYDGNIYKCTSAHSAGAWAAGDFTLVAVASELESKQDTLTFDDTPTDNSNNPVKSNGIYDALTLKANNSIVADDFSTATTYAIGDYCIYDGGLYRFKAAHTGAWSAGDVDAIKITGELATLKSGLIDVNNGIKQTNANLNVPNRKNILPMTVSGIKAINTLGTWDGNVYTLHGVTFTVNTNSNGDVTSIVATGTATSEAANIMLVNNTTPNVRLELNGKNVIYSGCPAGGSENTYNLYGWKVTTAQSGVRDTGSGVTFNAINMDSSFNFAAIIGANYEIPTGGITFYPMIRESWVSDSSFAPYIPSVENRISSIFMPTRRLTSADNLNNVIATGTYYTRSSDNPTNYPAANCIIAVLKHCDASDVNRYIQIAYSFNTNLFYVRSTTDAGTTWTAWSSIDMTAVN